MLGERERFLEFLKDDLHNPFEFALFVRGKMIEACSHREHPSNRNCVLHVQICRNSSLFEL